MNISQCFMPIKVSFELNLMSKFGSRKLFQHLAFSQDEMDSIKTQLQNSCYFKLSAGLVTGSHAWITAEEIPIRYYVENGIIYYHVTNSNRKKLLKIQ
jgi:hypothetical protein